jgi:hypothetical protein
MTVSHRNITRRQQPRRLLRAKSDVLPLFLTL